VRASLVLARADAEAIVRGGTEADARDVVAKGIAIDADGEACEGALDSAGVIEADGYAIDATFACTHPPHALAITMYLVSELPRGHRHRARVEAGASTAQAMLDAEHRQLTLTIDTNVAPEAMPTPRRLIFVLGCAIALAAALTALVIAFARLRRARRGT